MLKNNHLIFFVGMIIYAFFSRKTASQWNNPSFQSFNIVQSRASEIQMSNIFSTFISPNGSLPFLAFLKIVQFLILVGTLLWCIMSYNHKISIESLLLPLIFIGGFVFHTFWEAKCEYTISYFVLLFPYAILGYEKAIDSLTQPIHDRIVKARYLAPLVILVLLSVLLTYLYGFGRGAYLTQDTEEYLQYLQDVENSES
jgi:hypothetical protein